jgi:hypothetical protein
MDDIQNCYSYFEFLGYILGYLLELIVKKLRFGKFFFIFGNLANLCHFFSSKILGWGWNLVKFQLKKNTLVSWKLNLESKNVGSWEWGESTLSPPKIVITSIIFLQLKFLVTYGHHILDYFYFLKVYLISFKLNLINYFENFNKHWKIWMYVHLWPNITCHTVWKFEYVL